MKKTLLSAVLAATALTSVPAFGDPPPWAPAHGRRHHEQQRYDQQRYDNYDRHDYYERDDDDDRDDDDGRNGRYDNDYQRDYRRTSNGIDYWRGDDDRYYCRRGNGTIGLLVGAALDALLGRDVSRGRTRCN